MNPIFYQQLKIYWANLIKGFCMVVFFSSVTFAQTLESDDIRKSFNDYKAAVLATDGDKAVIYVDQKTVAYYDRILRKSLTADSLTIDTMDIIDKLVILTVRQSTSTSELETMDGESLFIYAIDNGLVGKNSVQNNSIGKVEVDGNNAKATLVSNGTPTQSAFDYHLENEIWKVDLTSIFPEAEVAFKSIAKSSGQTDNDYIMMVIQFATNEKPKKHIWQPLKN